MKNDLIGNAYLCKKISLRWSQTLLLAGLLGLILLIGSISGFWLLFPEKALPIAFISTGATPVPTNTPIAPTCDCQQVKDYLLRTADRLDDQKNDAGAVDRVMAIDPNNTSLYKEFTGRAKARYDQQHEEIVPPCMSGLNTKVNSMFYSFWRGLEAFTTRQYDYAMFNLKSSLLSWGGIRIELEELHKKLEQCKPGEIYHQG